MFTTKIYVRPDKGNALTLRVTRNRKKAELSLGFSATEEELAAILAGTPDRKNRQLASLVSIWQGKIEQLKVELAQEGRIPDDPKEIRDMLGARFTGRHTAKEKEQERRQSRTLGFEAYFELFLNRRPQGRTRDIYAATLSRLKAFDTFLHEKSFEEVTVRYLTDFDTFLSRTSPSPNARAIHMRNIRAVFNSAIDDEMTQAYPFRRFHIRSVPTRKRSLSVETLRRIFNAEGLEDWEWKYLDFFKLSFMLIGINAVDLCNLTEMSEGRIEYDRAKTHKPYSIKVEPEAMELIRAHKGARHLLDFTDNYSNYRHFYNNLCVGLASIRKRLRIRTLSTYWARHTWSTIAAELDIPDAVISSALGHSSENATTAIYIKRNRMKVDRANRMVLDWVLYGKREVWA